MQQQIVSEHFAFRNENPISSTHTALVWNSVEIEEDEAKKFKIRNTSNNEVQVQVDICDDSKSFKFLGGKRSMYTSMILTMRSQERRKLTVVFSPYTVGAKTGKITIKLYRRESNIYQQYKQIFLYGYGGNGGVEIEGTLGDDSGKHLPLGILHFRTTLNKNFTLSNMGDLSSFAKIMVIPKVISPTLDFSWLVNPKEVILDGYETQEISIQFHISKKDFALHFQQRSEELHVATINIIHGDEPTRQRIRRLYNKIKESGESIGVVESEIFKNKILPIVKAFPEEQLIPDLTSIRDPIRFLSDLCTGVFQDEIMLKVKVCADDTSPLHYDTDESDELYYSLEENYPTLVDEAGGASSTLLKPL